MYSNYEDFTIMWIRTAALAALVSSLASAAPAQAPKLPGFFAAAKATVAPVSVKAGAKATLTVTITMAPGFHIYDPKPGDEFAIPSEVTPTKVAGVTYGKAVWPAPTLHEKTRIHEGTITVTVPITLAKTVKPGTLKLGAAVKAQGCNATGCLPPETVQLSAPLTVSK
ncbi:protein-disulfide reductase DsbD N-terminal domain-containing protein [Armatimonas rosea]|uniref:DsbC/DsbD-like thiol-disulfide interchange protein n=1 Tax=Armatimonas rosea TaxID=685828 RepID=A0A7W9SRS1_ARMRO|nr:protein-disulfide reductase DsbD N-terminal domain-containing protein [Armatimonas rosea]MBB6050994.1 DsbC/DsbD-like thiol-disulfide interchange protein [Armatimonas rosea]